MRKWKYIVPYTDAMRRCCSASSMSHEYLRMLKWFADHDLERGEDYEWSMPITMYIGNIEFDDMPLFVYFDYEEDRLIFKLMFGV